MKQYADAKEEEKKYLKSKNVFKLLKKIQNDLIDCEKTFSEDKFDSIDLSPIEKAFDDCSLIAMEKINNSCNNFESLILKIIEPCTLNSQ